MTNISWKTLTTFLVLVSVFSIVFGYTFITYYVYDQNRASKIENQLMVSGEADLGVLEVDYTLNFQCYAKDKESARAFKQSSESCSKLAKTLLDLGIAKDKLTTQEIRMYNSGNYYNYYTNPNDPNTSNSLDYTAEQTLVLKDRFEKDKQDQLNGLNKIIDSTGVLERVAITNLSLTPATNKNYDQEGRILAIKDAKQKADQIAKAGGFRIGKVINVQDQVGYNPIPYYNKNLLSTADAKVASTEIYTGKNQITTRVNVNYEILR
jgi:uncharacterized protein